MPEANAGIDYSEKAIRGARSLANALNEVDSMRIIADPFANRKPEYYVGIFNVSKKPLVVAKPWVVGGSVIVEGRQGDDLYGKPFIINDVVPIPAIKGEEVTYAHVKGEFLAQDVVNSNDPYGNWKTFRPLNPSTSVCEGNNYYEQGIFWCRLDSPDGDPDFDAVETAITRMEAHYNRLIQEADQLWSGDPKNRAFISQPHHDAANYFEIDKPWHTLMTGGLRDKLKAKKAKKAAAESEDKSSI